MAFERWLSICKVLYAKRLNLKSFSRVIKVISFIWIFSGLVSLPYGFTTKVYNLIENENDSKICNTLSNKAYIMEKVILISVILFFILPTILIIFMYTQMVIFMKKFLKKN
jgi:hypothetical protein